MAVAEAQAPVPGDPRGEAMVAELKWVHDMIRRDLRMVRQMAADAAAGRWGFSIALRVLFQPWFLVKAPTHWGPRDPETSGPEHGYFGHAAVEAAAAFFGGAASFPPVPPPPVRGAPPKPGAGLCAPCALLAAEIV